MSFENEARSETPALAELSKFDIDIAPLPLPCNFTPSHFVKQVFEVILIIINILVVFPEIKAWLSLSQ